MKNSCVEIYCGDGKGKTTAAVGLAVRASGAGFSVLFVQFMKSGTSSELVQLSRLQGITVCPVENHFGFTWNMTKEQKQALRDSNDHALKQCIEEIKAHKYDVVIFDEIISAYNQHLIDENMVEYIVGHHEETEIVLTGREPNEKLRQMADYISDIAAQKHPYQSGLEARKGIEY